MSAPLPERVRPSELSDVKGQDRWLGPGAPLRRAFETGRFSSMVLWGPPGCGKTTLARLVAKSSNALFLPLSAVLSGVKDLRGALERAAVARDLESRETVLFIDEIHRWNKAQQDALLPHLEAGTVVLVGATTENPSFSLNPALRSRVDLIHLAPLSNDDVYEVLLRALAHGDGVEATVSDDALRKLAVSAAGDARRALADLEAATSALGPGETLDATRLADVLAREDLRHDRTGDDHYNVVSAFIKSMRGSDPDAAVYWLARLIAAGEDPRFIARRLVVFAAEDIGNADPRALTVATDAAAAVQLVGMPEGRIPLAQAATWLACSPKSDASIRAIDAALAEVRRTGALAVPAALRSSGDRDDDAPYRNPHRAPYGVVTQQHLPDELVGQRYYAPSPYAEELRIRERIAWWDARR